MGLSEVRYELWLGIYFQLWYRKSLLQCTAASSVKTVECMGVHW